MKCLRSTLQSRECLTFISPDEDLADFKSRVVNINIKETDRQLESVSQSAKEERLMRVKTE